MADEVTEETGADATESDESQGGKKSRGPLKLFVAVIALIGTGAALAMMAVPKKERPKVLQGPAMHQIFDGGELVGNPLDDNFSRYLKFTPSCSYLAYDLAYPTSRRADPHYEAQMREAMQYTVSEYLIDEVMSGANRDAFAAALEEVAEPILFPVHIGPTATPYETDAESGLRIGDSQERTGTFRGPYWEFALKVDATKKTIQLGDGPEQTFNGDEVDLMVQAVDGSTLYVDVSGLKEDFVGEVRTGVMGRIRRLFTGDIIAQ